ncbi:Pigt [Symbiodinium sp. CCMP2456]|nr:Pigt [Symbiodinium sp. CCMP2456]
MDPTLSSDAVAIAEGGGTSPAARLLTSGVGARPLTLPSSWTAKHVRLASLPYEPVCTENLTPWLKLLPCGRHRGLAALLASLVLPAAEAPLLSLSLVTTRDELSTVISASLDVVLPSSSEDRAASLPDWLKSFTERQVDHCPAAASSEIALWSPGDVPEIIQRLAESRVQPAGPGFRGQVSVFPTRVLSQVENMAQLFMGFPEEARTTSKGLRVMRDMLSQEGRSERTHGRYLLRLSNHGTGRHVRFLDQLPFFIRPLWHTIRAVWRSDNSDEVLELAGADALRHLALTFTASDGLRSPTDLSLTVDLSPGSSVSVFLDVLKNFIPFREFSYACEKGFDVAGAVWLDADLDVAGSGAVGSNIIAPLGPSLGQEAQPGRNWRLHFTEGMLVMVPMPDFSMPFNVIALSSTAVTFFFGSVFRITAAGRQAHWCTESGSKKRALHPVQVLILCIIAGAVALNAVTPEQLAQFRAVLPEAGGYGPEFFGYVVAAKDKVDSILSKR